MILCNFFTLSGGQVQATYIKNSLIQIKILQLPLASFYYYQAIQYQRKAHLISYKLILVDLVIRSYCFKKLVSFCRHEVFLRHISTIKDEIYSLGKHIVKLNFAAVWGFLILTNLNFINFHISLNYLVYLLIANSLFRYKCK